MTAPITLAPIALFAYTRPDHLRRTVDSLLLNAEARVTPLYVFCDAPRGEAQRAQTDAVRTYADSIRGFLSVTRIYRDQNLGLARSIISGVGQILEDYENVIVMEDDLLVSPHFLRYMNDGLRVYRDDAVVASIHGYTYPVSETLPETFFIRGADCWGWATWRRAWRFFEPDGQHLRDELRHQRLEKVFDLNGAYPYTQMLQDQIDGRNDSWAIRWHASCFLQNMLTLYPRFSLVNNIGFDDSGTHCASTDVFNQKLSRLPVSIQRVDLVENAAAVRAFRRFHERQTRPSLMARLRRAIRKALT